jgi:hypothetical protein
MGAFGASWFLYFGIAAAVPVIIHLIYGLRRKRVPTGAMWMIKRILEHNSRRLRLRDILLLLLRVAVIALLVLGFARPVGWNVFEKSGKTVVILDDSYPMGEVLAGGGTLFEATVSKLEPHLSGEAFHLVTLSGQSEGEFNGRGALIATLERIRPGYVLGDLTGALNRAGGVEGARRAIAAIGAWQTTGQGSQPPVSGALEYLEIVPMPQGCRLEYAGIASSPSGKGVDVKVKMSDDRNFPHVERLLRMTEGGQREEIVSRPAREDGVTILQAENLPQQGTVLLEATIDGRDGLAADDTVYVAVELLPPIRVAVIVDHIVAPEFLSPGFFVKTALSVGAGFVVDEYAVKELSIAVGRSDVLVFTEPALIPSPALPETMKKGWLVFACGKHPVNGLGVLGDGLEWGEAATGALALNSDFKPLSLAGADAFSGIMWGEGWLLNPKSAGWIAVLQDGVSARAVLREVTEGQGRRFVIGAPPDRKDGGDLPVHKVFVPLVREACAWAAGRTTSGGIQEKMRRVGEIWDLPEGTLRVTGPDGGTTEVQSISGKPGARLLQPGVYTAVVKSEGGTAMQLVTAANIMPLSGRESLSASNIGDVFHSSEEAADTEEKPDPAAGPWRVLAIIALAVLVVEALLSAAPIVRAGKP